MCGIAGYLGRPPFTGETEADRLLREAISYRGRDEHGEWTDDRRVRLFHSRLSVIDLQDGQQPMQDVSGRYVIVYNGEIYNYLELRKQYAEGGARFRTQSDTEVILEGYRLKGRKVCADLNGMFAFAIWDRRENTLFLARDHLGKKPLFWTTAQGRLYFSSTLDAFVGLPGFRADISTAAINFYGFTGQFPLAHSIYRQARSLPPGTHALVDANRLEPEPTTYWHPDLSPRRPRRSMADALDEYDQIITDAVRIRLRSDVPLALTFSGGVDSGTIAAVAARKLNRTLNCFTIDHHTADDPSEEVAIAERVARHLDLPFRHIPFDYRRELLSTIPNAYRHFDQPCSQLAMTYSLRLYETIKPSATVVLGGPGSDELFTGYNGDEEFRRMDRLRDLGRAMIPARLHSRLPRSLTDRLHLVDSVVDWQCDAVAHYVGDEDDGQEIIRDLRDSMLRSGLDGFLDLKFFMSLFFSSADANFRLPDVNGLQAQVEVRAPYLDIRLVDFAARLGHDLKIGRARDGTPRNKLLPKTYYERFVPGDVAWSPKKGMAFNVRFGEAFAANPQYGESFRRTMDALQEHGLETTAYRKAHETFSRDKLAGVVFPRSAGTMMTGFMLGQWFLRRQTPPGH